MKLRHIHLLAMLVALLVVSCTCSLLPLGVRLPEIRRLGEMTIHYPEGWETEREGDILVLSPESIGDFYEMEPQPMFIVVSGSQDDWVSEVYEDADRLLDEIADEIMADALGNRQTVEGDGISWRRASAEGTFDLFDQSVEGWLAVTIRGEEFSFVLAVAPGDAWDEYERIFDAMLERIEIG